MKLSDRIVQYHPMPAAVAALTSVFLLAGTLDRLGAAELLGTPTKGSLTIRVTSATGKKLAKAELQVSIWTKEKGFKANRNYRCDEDGQTVVQLPASLEIVRVWARKPGFAPMFGQLWPQGNGDGPPLPEEFTFKLRRGTTIGGVVQNEDSKPIEGARVEVQYESGGNAFGAPKPTRYDTWLANGDDAQVTDSDGKWSLDNVPPGDRIIVKIKISHQDYTSDTKWGGLQEAQNVTIEQLRNKTATIVMRRGYVVKGKITDPDGKPVKNAVVIAGDDPYSEPHACQEVQSDEQGNYAFKPLAAGPARITVVAQGWMPKMRKLDVGPGTQPADFQLHHGKKLRIKFVDGAGKPVPQVAVYVSKWRQAESLYSYRHPNVITLELPEKANDEGIFEWTWAPDDAVEYRFGKRGYAETTASIVADDQEHLQTIHSALNIGGTVSDAKTGKPVEKFRVVPVIYFRPDFPCMERSQAQDAQDGKFDMDFDRTDIEHGVQIEAPGYVTYRAPRRYHIGESNPTLNVKLEPCERYRGRVVDADGKPAQGAQVYVATGFQQLRLYDLGAEDADSGNYCVTVGDDGNFEIAPQMEKYRLVVVAPVGYVEVDHSATEPPGELRVQPWARIKGHVVQNGKPMPKCEVFLSPITFVGGDQPRLQVRQTATTGIDGSFSFERVPPIACRVGPFLHFSVESPLKSSRSVPLEPAPGSETSVELGGDGVEVTGQFVVDPPRKPFDYHFSLTWLIARRRGITPPAYLADKGFDWRKGWSDSWFQSQEGSAYRNTLHNWYVKPDPNGQFRISGVPRGKYELAVNLYGTTEGCLVHPVAQRVVQIEVADAQNPLDLGKLVIPSQDVPQVGDQAMNFKFETPEGKTTDLAAQRGKYVLLDFWATWCGPCVANLPEVEALRKEFGESKALVVVGANLDSEPEAAREFLRKKPLPWHHALLGDWSSTDVPKRYGISSVPAYVLVDPDGRIAALEYSADDVRKRLQVLADHR
jgi:thiol-disulfide isomerase/thioredoxin/uncharacterized GH25 family protein